VIANLNRHDNGNFLAQKPACGTLRRRYRLAIRGPGALANSVSVIGFLVKGAFALGCNRNIYCYRLSALFCLKPLSDEAFDEKMYCQKNFCEHCIRSRLPGVVQTGTCASHRFRRRACNLQFTEH